MHGKEQTLVAETARIKEIYEKNVNNTDDVYATLTKDNLIYYVKDKNGNTIPVPNGFSPITTEDQGTKETGFVIKNDIDGNEYVWVPCTKDGANGTIKYERYAFLSNQPAEGIDVVTNSTRIKWDNGYFIEKMPNIDENRTELDSVSQHGGFYIGRYELGITGYSQTVNTNNSNNAEIWTGYSNGTPVVQKGKQVWNYITRDKAKEVIESMYSDNDAVTSRLCSGYAWRTAIKFIETKYPNYAINSIQGNYKDTQFEYTDLDGTNKTKFQNTGILVPTGQTTAVNNIYDMGGNAWEWTTELHTDNSSQYTFSGGDGIYSTTSDTPAPLTYRSIKTQALDNLRSTFSYIFICYCRG